MAEKITEKARTTANQSGMGAIPHAKGVTFRVWAPHAQKVYLIGSFNGWNETSTPLVSEKNGYWSAAASEARAGDECRYLIHGLEGSFSCIDPYARKVTNAAGNGIIYDPQAFDWGDDSFNIVSWNELIISSINGSQLDQDLSP
ncbi:MAG TPA: hypothetical protein VFG29_07745 [Syntrophales bacterium]|nr:hypothetical protein [Syntrophales bacterium]